MSSGSCLTSRDLSWAGEFPLRDVLDRDIKKEIGFSSVSSQECLRQEHKEVRFSALAEVARLKLQFYRWEAAVAKIELICRKRISQETHQEHQIPLPAKDNSPRPVLRSLWATAG